VNPPDSRAPIGSDAIARRLDELRPVASVTRLALASVTALALWAEGGTQGWVFPLLLAYMAWMAVHLWRETSGQGGQGHPLYFLLTLLLMVAAVRGTEHGGLLIPLAVYPLVLVSLLHGLRRGLVVATTGAVVLMVSLHPPGVDPQFLLPALGLLLIPPISTLAARPIAALRHRLHLAADLERELDPRRGLQTVGLAMADRLRLATGAQRVIVCHRDAELPTVLVADQDDTGYEASPALAARLLALVADLPARAMSLDTRGGTGGDLLGDAPLATRQALQPQVREIAEWLEAEQLQLVPDAPGDPRSNWWLLAHGARPRGARARFDSAGPWPLQPLSAFARDMRWLVQQASYADTLQAEIAASERARIGRDLHDSALQPYLGLKFAIDVVAQRCAPDNPLHGPVQDLRRFCETELDELRDTVAVMRNGEVRGDNALVPALRRQASRFAALFGIETHLELPEALVTSRALSGAVLHMVNEALNNVRRHTRARQAWVRLALEPGRLHLVVRDDAARRSGFPMPSFEPRSLMERARELGGTLELRRHEGLDTEIHITLPI
jgi:signal transduction histidine kinase